MPAYGPFTTALIVFGAAYLIFAMVAAVLVFAARLKRAERKRFFIFAAVVLPMTFVISRIAKLFYEHARPFAAGGFVPLVPHAPDNSFPSDHALLGGSLAAAVYPFNKPLGIALFALTLLVGAARVAAGVHYPIDIIGGLAIAAASAAVAHLFFRQKAWPR